MFGRDPADIHEILNTGLLQGICTLDAHFSSQSSEAHRSQYRSSHWSTFNDFGNDGSWGHYALHSHQQGEQDSSGAISLLLPFPRELTVPKLEDVTKGLRYLHACGIVHGDLKGVSSRC